MRKDINLICRNKLMDNEYAKWLQNLKAGDKIIYEIDNIRQREKVYVETTIEGVSRKNIYVDGGRISKSVGAKKLFWYTSDPKIVTLLPYKTIDECYTKRSQNKSDYGYWI